MATARALIADPKLIAYCGLYCGACRRYLNGRCPGCHENAKATWCKVRTCCIDAKLSSCADCQSFTEVRDCKKLNNVMSKLFALLFRSDRFACLAAVKNLGYDGYAADMARTKRQSIKRV